MSSPQLLLKDTRSPQHTVIDDPSLDEDAPFDGIRCPLCMWRPSPASRWSCHRSGPEPFFEDCGTTWNTFSTRGRCPGCAHQWQWTMCLRCQAWSLHEEWYEEQDARP